MIIKLNSTSRNWSTPDFIDSYAQLGEVDYVTLKKDIALYSTIGYKHVTKILMGSKDLSTGNSCSRAIRSGDFKLGEYDENLLVFLTSILEVWDKLHVVSSRDCFISAIRFMWLFNNNPGVRGFHAKMDPEILLNRFELYGERAFNTFCDVEGAVIALDSIYISTGSLPQRRARFLQCAYDQYMRNQKQEKREIKSEKQRARRKGPQGDEVRRKDRESYKKHRDENHDLVLRREAAYREAAIAAAREAADKVE